MTSKKRIQPDENPMITGVSGIDRSRVTQGLLFDEPQRQRQAQLDEVSDLVKDRFGSSALRRGSSLEQDGRQKPERGMGESLK